MGSKYYKDEIFGYLAGDSRNHVVFYNNIEEYYKHIDNKREVVRNFITWIEATTNYMTEHLIEIGKQNPGIFDLRTMLQLGANGIEGSARSEPKKMTFIDKIRFAISLFLNNQEKRNNLLPKRMTFTNNFKFTFKLFATHYGLLPIYKVYIEKHFDNLLKVVAIRNKITHPRVEEDLYISKLDFDLMWQSYKDYYEFQIKFFDGIFYEDREE